MSDFEPRPKGTVMYGAFDAFAPAERALRVLKNAGYARAAFEADDVEERASGEPTVLVVDAAAAGALRAAEILEEFGARIRFAAQAPVRVEIEVEAPVESVETPVAVPLAAQPTVLVSEEPPATPARSERKPRVRKRRRQMQQPNAPLQQPNAPAPSEALAWDNIIIVTRPIESVATDG